MVNEMKNEKIELVKKSKCCNYDVRYNGFVGLTCYGWTCNRCDRKCKTHDVEIYS